MHRYTPKCPQNYEKYNLIALLQTVICIAFYIQENITSKDILQVKN